MGMKMFLLFSVHFSESINSFGFCVNVLNALPESCSGVRGDFTDAAVSLGFVSCFSGMCLR